MAVTQRATTTAPCASAAGRLASRATSDDLPAPPAPGSASADAHLWLEIVLNGEATGETVPVHRKAGQFLLQADVVQRLGVQLPTSCAGAATVLAIDRCQSVEVRYDSHAQTLHIDVPPAWLPIQRIGSSRQEPVVLAPPVLAAVLDYDVWVNEPWRTERRAAAWLHQRLIRGAQVLSNSGLYRYQGRSPGASNAAVVRHARPDSGDGYLRYDTSWQLVDEAHALTYTLGDAISGALPWSTPVRMAGVSVARDFAVRPDIVTYPLPNFAGQAAVPSAVEVLIDGSRAFSGALRPGPFAVAGAPFIGGAGDATIVTTDVLGRRTETSLPFYVATTLLQPGLSDYSLTLGALRRDYGIRSFAYGKMAGSVSMRYGISERLTAEWHAEGGQGMVLAGVGAATRLARAGVVDVAIAGSYLKRDSPRDRRATRSVAMGDAAPRNASYGRQWALGYQFASRLANFTARGTWRDAAFADLASYDRPRHHQFQRARRSLQLSAALNLPRAAGTLGIAYFDLKQPRGPAARVANLSYSRALLGASSLFVSLNRFFGQRGTLLQAVVNLPIYQRDAASEDALASTNLAAALTHTPSGRLVSRLQAMRNPRLAGGLGYTLGFTAGAPRYREAGVSWRTPYFEARAGADGEAGKRSSWRNWSGLSGSLVAIGGAAFATNRIDDAFAVVDTNGYGGIPVRYENQLVGTTNRRGYLLVPSVAAYYSAKYEIEPLGLPADIRVDEVERRLAVRRRGGARVHFDLQHIEAAQFQVALKLRDAKAKGGARAASHWLPPGSTLQLRESSQRTRVGWDGLVYLEGVRAVNRFDAQLPDGRRCAGVFSVDLSQPGLHRLAPMSCE